MAETAPHIPVLISSILGNIEPVSGVWLDGTFGAGGYTRALLDAGAEKVIAIDRDPEVFTRAKSWAGEYGDRLVLKQGVFGELDRLADEPLDGIVLDIGVSSMQIDQAERGFSFMRSGPLDMRMSQAGPSAADIVNRADEGMIADILFQFGEERKSRRIAHGIVGARQHGDFSDTLELVRVVEKALPRSKPGQPHPATRSFQALRIAVNDELGELARGLNAAEAALKPGGILAVVSFHSLEDRMVKRFIQNRSGNAPQSNRFAPELESDKPRFKRINRKAIEASEAECSVNPRARSAKLRLARRLDAPAEITDPFSIGMPRIDLTKGGIL